jgi:hypothetical protein
MTLQIHDTRTQVGNKFFNTEQRPNIDEQRPKDLQPPNNLTPIARARLQRLLNDFQTHGINPLVIPAKDIGKPAVDEIIPDTQENSKE